MAAKTLLYLRHSRRLLLSLEKNMKRGFLNTTKARPKLETEEGPQSVVGPAGGALFVQTDSGIIGMNVDYDFLKVQEASTKMGGSHMLSEAGSDVPDVMLVFTRVAGVVEEDGTTECMLRGAERRKIAAIPNFPQTYKKPCPPNFHIDSVPNMGLGMFATRDLQAGEIILVERPIAVIPRQLTPSVVSGRRGNMNQEQVLMEWHSQLQILVDRMSPENREAFDKLANVFPEQGMFGVINTNSFGLSELMASENNDTNTYGAICKLGSRINHSCSPNTTLRFNLESFSYQFLATREIRKGDQFFYSYCNILERASTRAKALQKYAFKCTCKACVGPTFKSDQIREGIQRRVEKIIKEFEFPKTRKKPNLFRLRVMRPALEALEAMDCEDIQDTEQYSMLLDIISKGYKSLGEMDSHERYQSKLNASNYFNRVKEHDL